jgi:hypothetical protein
MNGNENLPVHFIPKHFQDGVVARGKVVFSEGEFIRNDHDSLSEKVSVFHGSEPKAEYFRKPEHHTISEQIR